MTEPRAPGAPSPREAPPPAIDAGLFEAASALLCDPAAYPHPAGRVEVHETHISRVFLAGDRAYKLKKPVWFNFLDYSTPALRRRFCEAELRLNRRLAPRVYEGLVHVIEVDGRARLVEEDPGERLHETLVRMRRVDPSSLLLGKLQDGSAGEEHIDRLVRVLQAFYARAERPGPSSPLGTPESVRATLLENFEAVDRFGEDLIPSPRRSALRSALLSFLTLEADAFRARRAEGRVVDGHGDLRAEHVAFLPEDGACVVLDCVEFSERLRVVDIASDLAFLAMDLEMLGAPRLARRLIEGHVAASGDRGLERLLPFYTAYRAMVRGKVDGLKLAQGGLEPAAAEALRRRAQRHFELACFHALSLGRPLVVAVSGLSGTGKSTLARLLGEALGAPVIRSDIVRKELAAAGGEGPALYSEERTAETYRALERRCEEAVQAGGSVILDATYSLRSQREGARRAAQGLGARWALLECAVDPAVAAARMRERAERGGDPSDATPDIQSAQAARYEAPAPGEARVVRTGGTREAALDAALLALRALHPSP